MRIPPLSLVCLAAAGCVLSSSAGGRAEEMPSPVALATEAPELSLDLPLVVNLEQAGRTRFEPNVVLKTPTEREALALVPMDSPECVCTRSRSIRVVQQQLKILGYAVGALDGVLSDRTIAALRRFQGDVGIEEQEALGPQTCAALARAAQESMPPLQRTVVGKLMTYGQDLTDRMVLTPAALSVGITGGGEKAASTGREYCPASANPFYVILIKPDMKLTFDWSPDFFGSSQPVPPSPETGRSPALTVVDARP